MCPDVFSCLCLCDRVCDSVRTRPCLRLWTVFMSSPVSVPFFLFIFIRSVRPSTSSLSLSPYLYVFLPPDSFLHLPLHLLHLSVSQSLLHLLHLFISSIFPSLHLSISSISLSPPFLHLLHLSVSSVSPSLRLHPCVL